jgi:SSS family solute:Na+ symporter
VSTPVLLAYLALLLGFAVFQWRKGRENEGYFLAHRQLPFGLAFATYLATSIGSSSTLVQASLIGKYGWKALALEFGGAVGFVLFGLFLAGRIRRTQAFSLPHVLGQTYGAGVQKTASVLVVVAEVLWLALILRALITLALFSPFTLVLMFCVFLAAMVLGGQWGLAWMDVVQAALIFAGFAALCAFVPSPVSRLPSPEPMPGILIYSLFFSTLLPHIAGSDIWGKALSARDGTVAARAAVAAGIGKAAWALLLFFVVVRFGLPPAGDKTLPALFGMLPPWLAVLPILSLLAALLSSANSVLLTAATTLQHDLFTGLQARRLLTLALGVAGAALAWAAPSLLSLFMKSYGFFAVAVSAPALLAFLPRRPHRRWVIAGMIGGGLLALWLPLLPALVLALAFHLLGLLLRE